MRVEFPSLSFQLRQDLAAIGIELPLGHVQQCLAASYGFGSLAAYQAAVRAWDASPGMQASQQFNFRKL